MSAPSPTTWLDVLQGSGRFVLMVLLSALLLLLGYGAYQLIARLDVSKVDPTQLLTIIVTGAITLASGAVAYYFGQKSQQA